MYLSRNSRRSALALVLVAGLALAGCAPGGSAESTDAGGGEVTEIPLGATIELSGGAASTGVPWSRGIELGVAEANGENGFEVGGKQYKWALDLQDNQSTPDQAIAQYRGFVGDGTKFFAGPTLSSAFVPAFNSLGNAPALVLTPSSIAKTVEPTADQAVFITLSNGEKAFNESYAQAVLDATGAKSVSIILPQDAVSDSFVGIFTDFFTAQGVTVIDTKRFPPDTTNFAPYINSLQADNPDLVLTGYLDKWVQPLLQQSVSSGFESANWMMTVGTTEGTLVDSAGGIKQIYFPIPVKSVVNPDDPMLETFTAAWTEAYGAAPVFNDFNALAYYDPILILTKALQDAGTVDDIPAIAAAMSEVTEWDGAASEGGFDSETHVRAYPVNYGVIENGEATYSEVK